MKTIYDLDSQTHQVDIIPDRSGKSFRVHLGEKTTDVQILQAGDGKLELLIDGRQVTAYVSPDSAKRWVTVNGQTLLLVKSSGARPRGAAHSHAAGELTAPMPGQVRAVNVSEGEPVTKGQTLLLLEAMKMEIRVQAPRGGVVKRLFVRQGQSVEREQMLIEIADSLEG
jgi:biotin carboxyl carrier protein